MRQATSAIVVLPKHRVSSLVALTSLAGCFACGSAGGTGRGMDEGRGMPSGGSGAAGAPAGNGGAPTVGNCDELGEPGVWQSILPKQSETGQELGVVNAQGLALDPFDVGTVWMGASSVSPKSAGGLFKSTDCGSTWTHVNTGLNGAKLDTAAIWSLAIDPVTRGTVYVVGAYGPGNLWKSTNGGVDFTPLLAEDSEFATVVVGGNFVASVTMDPNDPLHLVIAPHGDCKPPYDPICNAESKDGGATWRLVRIPGNGWGEATGPYLLDRTSWLSTLGGLWLTVDDGTTWKDVKPVGVNYVTGGEFTHRPLRKSPLGNFFLPSQEDNGLITSSDGLTWSHVAGTPNGSYELGLALGGGRIYLGDNIGNDYEYAEESAPDQWTTLPAPAAEYDGSTKGPVNLEYDEKHHVLYSTNFEGGFWRMVTP